MIKIPLNKPYAPTPEELAPYISAIAERAWLTNFGPLARELEQRLADYLGVRHLLLVSNGTLAIQIALRALEVKGAILSTPFTFVATSSAAAWLGHSIRYADIRADSFNLDPEKARTVLTGKKVGAILPVHTFGTACEVESFARLGLEAQCPVVYDAAHAFGVRYKGRSLLHWGDAATLSLHATKVFHCVEGGAVVFRSAEHWERARRLINFGLEQGTGNIRDVGINAKLSEYHAAVGLCMLNRIDRILEERAEMEAYYRQQLGNYVDLQQRPGQQSCNGAYMPVLLGSAEQVGHVQACLMEEGIQSRRYFYPDLGRLDIMTHRPCRLPVAERVADSILCLPLFHGITKQEVDRVCEVLKGALMLSQTFRPKQSLQVGIS